MSEIVHRRTYRLGELPQWVVTYAEGAAAYIDTQAGRYHLKPGDVILYDADWNPIDVERAAR